MCLGLDAFCWGSLIGSPLGFSGWGWSWWKANVWMGIGKETQTSIRPSEPETCPLETRIRCGWGTECGVKWVRSVWPSVSEAHVFTCLHAGGGSLLKFWSSEEMRSFEVLLPCFYCSQQEITWNTRGGSARNSITTQQLYIFKHTGNMNMQIRTRPMSSCRPSRSSAAED